MSHLIPNLKSIVFSSQGKQNKRTIS